MKNALIIYHNADFDGFCSGAIAAYYCKKNKINFTFYGMNYGDPFDKQIVRNYDGVIILDFSFPMEDMAEMRNLLIEANISVKKIGRFDGYVLGDTNFIWIDHHKSSISDCTLFQMDNPKIDIFDGMRDVNLAACELAWQYFFPKKYTPEIVRFLGRYDVWDHKDENVPLIQLGINAKIDLYDLKSQSSLLNWETLFDDTSERYYLIEKFLENGMAIEEYVSSTNKKHSSYAFETEFEGHKAVIMNVPGFGSKFFKDYKNIDKFNLMIGFVVTENWIYVSLRSDKPNVDCSVIAKYHGGGGHPGAAGFKTKEFLNFKIN